MPDNVHWLKESSVMAVVTGSKHPGDALLFLGSVIALLNEGLSMGAPGRNMELSEQAASGLCYMLNLVNQGINEVYSVL